MKNSRQNMSAAALVAAAVALLAAAAGGCATQPTATFAGLTIQSVDMDAITLQADVDVSNPYALPLPLANLDYSLASKGAAFLSGKADLEGTVPALGSRTLSLPLKITYRDLLSALSGAGLGQVVPYDAAAGLSVDVPVTGTSLRLPLEKSGQLPIPAPPDVKVEEVSWQNLSLDKASGIARLAVTNRNEWPLDMSAVDYALKLGGAEVARSRLAKPVALAANGGTGTVEIPLEFAPKDLGLAVFRMLSGSSSGYDLSGAMNVDTPFGPMSLPLSGSGNALLKR